MSLLNQRMCCGPLGKLLTFLLPPVLAFANVDVLLTLTVLLERSKQYEGKVDRDLLTSDGFEKHKSA
jgi:hypothetical protein